MAFWSKLFGERTGGDTSGDPEDEHGGEGPAGGADDGRLSFLEDVAQKLREASADLDFHRDVPAFALRLSGGDGGERTLFLENLFTETRDLEPDAREVRIRRFLAVFADAASTPATSISWEEARRKLVLCLRAATLTSAAGAGPCTLVRRPFVPMLLEMVALDTPTAIHYVGAPETEAWKVTPAELFAAAQATLASASTRLEPYDPDAPYPLWFVANNDDYEASRLLTPGWISSLSAQVNGRPIAVVPHSRLLIVGGDGDDDCVRRLVDVAGREYESSSRAISPALYTVDDEGKVVPLRLPEGHSLASDVELGHRKLAQTEYFLQQKALEGSAEERQDVAFVATYTLLKRKDGTFLSYATWSKDVPSLLPQVDRVAFVAGLLGKESFMAPWSAVASLDPPCLVPDPEMYPPRYRTVRWPTSTELESLRKLSG